MSDKAHKVLIIEDDKEISDMLLDFLSKNGFVADAAPNGLVGLKQVVSGDYSLILLDLMLPFKSGDELLREMRKFSDVPVIYGHSWGTILGTLYAGAYPDKIEGYIGFRRW